jgi:Type II secretory pathway, component PulF
MAQYTYKARDKYGKLIKGNIEAASPLAAERQVEKLELIPISIEEPAAGLSLEGFLPDISLFGGISKKDVIVFSRQLATLYQSGVPFGKSIDSLMEFSRNKAFKACLPK